MVPSGKFSSGVQGVQRGRGGRECPGTIASRSCEEETLSCEKGTKAEIRLKVRDQGEDFGRDSSAGGQTQEPGWKAFQRSFVPAVRRTVPAQHQGQPHRAGISRHDGAGERSCVSQRDFTPPGCLASCSFPGTEQVDTKHRWNDLGEEERCGVRF